MNRLRPSNFRCLYSGALSNDSTQEVSYTTVGRSTHQSSPQFAVNVSIDGLTCSVPADKTVNNPIATNLLSASTATLLIASKDSEHVPQFGADYQVQYNPETNTCFICVLAPSVEVASTMATQMRTHKYIGVYIEFDANEDDFEEFDLSHLLSIPAHSISITFYMTNPS